MPRMLSLAVPTIQVSAAPSKTRCRARRVSSRRRAVKIRPSGVSGSFRFSAAYQSMSPRWIQRLSTALWGSSW